MPAPEWMRGDFQTTRSELSLRPSNSLSLSLKLSLLLVHRLLSLDRSLSLNILPSTCTPPVILVRLAAVLLARLDLS
jgi:hypothetical protein